MMIVEDEPVQRTILAQTFRREGNDVRAFSSAESAVEIVHSWQPEIVICDLDLLAGPGEEVAEAADALAFPAWIVLLSVDAQRLERARSLADTVLRKPFPLGELTELVETMNLTDRARIGRSRRVAS
jgi:CheY-like chemotaxis protein